MRQAMILYMKIKKNQLILALSLGVLLTVIQVGSSIWQYGLHGNFSAEKGFGPVLIGVWLFIAAISLLNDQSRRLDLWLFTQNISRGQLFIARIFWLVIVPIVAAIVVDGAIVGLFHPTDFGQALNLDIMTSAHFFFIASVMAGIYTIIGPNWMKIAGAMFVGLVAIQPLTLIYKLLEDSKQPIQFMILILAGLLLFAVGYYLSTKISGDSIDEAVRLRILRWPVVIFVFVTSYAVVLANNSETLSAVKLFDLLLTPAILTGVTFTFVFKPTLKVTWDK